MRQLSGQDATFVFMEEPAVPMHLSAQYIYTPAAIDGASGVTIVSGLHDLSAEPVSDSPLPSGQ